MSLGSLARLTTVNSLLVWVCGGTQGRLWVPCRQLKDGNYAVKTWSTPRAYEVMSRQILPTCRGIKFPQHGQPGCRIICMFLFRHFEFCSHFAARIFWEGVDFTPIYRTISECYPVDKWLKPSICLGLPIGFQTGSRCSHSGGHGNGLAVDLRLFRGHKFFWFGP